MSWNKDDLSQYDLSRSPWYSIQLNGKTDIGSKLGDEEKISLNPSGMFKLFNEWLDSNHGLSKDEKAKLIEKLSK